MGLFDAGEEHPPSKVLRYIITGVAFVAAIAGFSWYMLRYRSQERTVRTFLNDLSTGNLQGAFAIWSHAPDYSFKDFLDDWGDSGYYGPVKSYHVEGVTSRGEGVIIVVEVSPFQPFPGNDVVKQSKTKLVRLWVQGKENFVSDAPP